jgi:hypothetical protein
MAYWKDNNPFDLAVKNADKLRDRTFIRIVAHSESGHWLAPQCEKLHKILVDNMIQHEYCFLVNVKSHNPTQCMDTLGDAAFSFFSSSLAHKPVAQAAGGGSMNPRMQEIRRKMQSGQPLTDEERQIMQQFQQSRAAQAPAKDQ